MRTVHQPITLSQIEAAGEVIRPSAKISVAFGGSTKNGPPYKGKNVRFRQRYAERFPELANDLVSLSVANNRSAE